MDVLLLAPFYRRYIMKSKLEAFYDKHKKLIVIGGAIMFFAILGYCSKNAEAADNGIYFGACLNECSGGATVMADTIISEKYKLKLHGQIWTDGDKEDVFVVQPPRFGDKTPQTLVVQGDEDLENGEIGLSYTDYFKKLRYAVGAVYLFNDDHMDHLNAYVEAMYQIKKVHVGVNHRSDFSSDPDIETIFIGVKF